MYLFIGIEVLNFGILLKKSNTYLVKKILIFKKISILLVQGDIYVILHVLKKDNEQLNVSRRKAPFQTIE